MFLPSTGGYTLAQVIPFQREDSGCLGLCLSIPATKPGDAGYDPEDKNTSKSCLSPPLHYYSPPTHSPWHCLLNLQHSKDKTDTENLLLHALSFAGSLKLQDYSPEITKAVLVSIILNSSQFQDKEVMVHITDNPYTSNIY